MQKNLEICLKIDLNSLLKYLLIVHDYKFLCSFISFVFFVNKILFIFKFNAGNCVLSMISKGLDDVTKLDNCLL